jgi:hypothetical protein
MNRKRPANRIMEPDGRVVAAKRTTLAVRAWRPGWWLRMARWVQHWWRPTQSSEGG